MADALALGLQWLESCAWDEETHFAQDRAKALLADRKALIRRAERAEAALGEQQQALELARACLKRIEWIWEEGPEADFFCPGCGCSTAQGHDRSCDLAAVLVVGDEPAQQEAPGKTSGADDSGAEA